MALNPNAKQPSDYDGATFYNTNTGTVQRVNVAPDGTTSWSDIEPFQGEVQGTSTYDPYAAERAAAAAAEQKRLNAAREQFGIGKTNVYDSARSGAQGFLGSQRNNILDFIDSLRQRQQGIDRSRVKSELGKRRASQGIMSMVGRGIQSGGVMLSNRNAADSSAAGAIAKAYQELGNRQQSNVNNQYALEQEDIDLEQQALQTQRQSGQRRFATEKEATVNGIVEQARAAFAGLNEAAIGAGITERIAIEQEKEAIRQQALSQLAELDSLASSANQVQAMGRGSVFSETDRLSRLGQGEASQYDFTTEAPVNLQQGAAVGQLPIYTNRRNRER